jgi:membrane fusion protein (multidrug efflux system)
VDRVAAKLRFAQTALDRVRPLRQRDTISAADFEQAEALVATTRAELAEARAAAQRGEQDRQAQELACETRIARLEREAVELTGEGEVAAAAIRRLEREVAERLVRAPIAGRIAEVGAVRAGTVIAAGEKLCAVVPEGAPRAVAKFSPSVVGRLKPGQAARLRIDGFPWTQFGAVSATVERIDTEPREGLVRVELALVPVSTSAIPLEHGLTGAAEVEVERAAPIVLALRAAGQFLGTRANPRSKR